MMMQFAKLALLALLAVIFSTPLSAQGAAKATERRPDKIVVAFQKQKDPQAIQETADRVAAFLTAEVGIPVQVMVPASYSASIQALISNHAQVAYLSSIPFVLARNEAPVELMLAEVREGRTDYDSVFVVRKDSPYQTLADLKGARMMFTSATSTSGYVMAYSRLVNEGLVEKRQNPGAFFRSVNFAGGYDRALIAVHRGQADVCAVSDYTVEGDKADVYTTAAMRGELRVLAETPGVPTHLVCNRKDLPADIKEKLKAAFLKLSAEQPELLSDVYGAAEFKEVPEDEHIATTLQALDNTGLAVADLAK